MLRGVLRASGAAEVRVMTAVPIPAVAEPFIRLRAIAHLERGHLVVLAGASEAVTSPQGEAVGSRT